VLAAEVQAELVPPQQRPERLFRVREIAPQGLGALLVQD